MDNFLAARPDEAEEQEQEEREDEMDIDEPEEDDDRPVRGGAPLDRVVDRQEMHGFVELFMYHAIKSMLSSVVFPRTFRSPGYLGLE